MSPKNLILLCDSYPTSAGEFFIDDEMRVIAEKFEQIFVFLPKGNHKNVKRFVPNNIQIIEFDANNITTWQKIKKTPFIFSSMFFAELKTIHQLKIKLSPSIFKIMFMDFVKAHKLKNTINTFVKSKKLNINNAIFYSYWHDYKVLALSILKNKNTQITCFARAHGWDNFRERQNPPYLPFKRYLLQQLSQTLTISEVGKQAFLLYGNFENKITVSRLGKHNFRNPLIKKENEGFHFVSCSNIIEVKQVHLIVDLIAHLSLENIHWTHFGDGNLRNKVENYATKRLNKNCSFEFKGIVSNNEILDFYANNYIDLFINLSASEGIPVSIMEALSAGIPILATNVGGTAEAVNKSNGFLVEENVNIKNTAHIISNYLSSSPTEQEAYRQNAYHFWQQNYEGTKNYTEFYEIITKNHAL